MDEEEIIDDVESIFDKEWNDNRKWFNVDLEQDKLSYQNLEILLQYHSNLSPDGKNIFIRDIKNWIKQWNNIIKDNGVSSLVPLGLMTLTRLWFLSDWLDYITPDFWKESNLFWIVDFLNVLLSGLLWDITKQDSKKILHIINELNLKGLDVNMWSKNFRYKLQQAHEKLIQYRFEKVKKWLNQIDIEISSDQAKLQELINNFWFDDDINAYLSGLDKYIYEGLDDVVIAWLISTFREFIGKIITSAAEKISHHFSEKIPDYLNEKQESLSPIWKSRKYIKEKLKLSWSENNLLNKYIEILHIEWGHSLSSEPKYFRLAKNIGIELSYFILSKTNDLINSSD